MLPKLLVIVGPTASGKTALAINIAKKYSGEIIAADSRTVYKYMDIGTAKPNLTEQAGILHWGLDLASPGQQISVSDFKSFADKKIKAICERDHLPILVGGSGLYVDAVIYDFSFAPTNYKLRQKLADKTESELQQEIVKRHLKMPENNKNKRYLIRTLERGDIPITKKMLRSHTIMIGLNPTRQILRERIEQRAHQMLKKGVLSEIKQAAKQYGWQSEAMTAGIYKVFKPFLEGKISQSKAIENYIVSDMQLAKKQLTWFKRNPDIHWFKSTSDARNWFDKQVRGKL